MRDPIILLVHLIATLARLMGPGGLRSVVAESLLVKHQLLILIARDTGRRISACRIGSSLVSVRCSCARLVCSARRSRKVRLIGRPLMRPPGGRH